jgi:hypothetical protein
MPEEGSNSQIRCPHCGARAESSSVICPTCHVPLLSAPDSSRSKRPREGSGSQRSWSLGRAALRRLGKGDRRERPASPEATNRGRGKHSGKHAERVHEKHSERVDLSGNGGGTGGESPEGEAVVLLRDGGIPEDERPAALAAPLTASENAAQVLEASAPMRSRHRHRDETSKASRWRRIPASTGGSVLWEGHLSPGQRVRHSVPEPVLDFARRVRERPKLLLGALAAALAIAVAAAALITLGAGAPRGGQIEGIDISLEVPRSWHDITGDPSWNSRLVVAGKIRNLGAQPALVIAKDEVVLAVFYREPSTDTTPPAAAAADFEEVAMVYSLAPDARVVGRGTTELFGETAGIVTADIRDGDRYKREEFSALARGNKIVYVAYSSPESQWVQARAEVASILSSFSGG